jgi:energy-coupling factor transporter transmembrane protein EcfT
VGLTSPGLALPIFAAGARTAQQARADLAGVLGAFALQPVLIAMIIAALRNSEHLGWALEARAMGTRGVRRTVFRPLHMTRLDWLAAEVLLAVLLAAALLRVL